MQRTKDYQNDPHLSVATKKGLEVLNSGVAVETLPKEKARKVLADVQAGIKVDLSGVEESAMTIQANEYSIRLNIVRPEGKKVKMPAFIFIHGGGWILGDYPTHRRLVRDLVVASGYTAVFVNYTPSPEAKYPQALQEIYAAVQWIAGHGEEILIDGTRIALVGNSVGGNMSIVTSMIAKKNNGPEIKLQVLMWPVADARFDTESYKMYGKQRFLTTSLMKWMFDQYIPDKQRRDDIYISPLQASVEELSHLPPTLIQVAENDILRDEAEVLGRKLDEAGVDVATIRYNGVIHDFGMLNIYAWTPQTRNLILNSAAMLKHYLR